MTSIGAKLKAKKVENLSKKIEKAESIAIGDLFEFDAYTIQLLRKELREKGLNFVFEQKTVLIRALEKRDKALADYAKKARQPFIIAGSIGIGDLAKLISKYVASKYIKAGEIAEEDIVIPAGPTPFSPGPMTVKFSSLGIKTKNEGGKISVMQDTIVCKKGEKVKPEVASLLSTLGIKAVRKNLQIIAAYLNGLVINKETLSVYFQVQSLLSQAISNAIGLSIAREIIDRDNISYFIRKIYILADNLMLIRGIPSKENIGRMLLKAKTIAERLNK